MYPNIKPNNNWESMQKFAPTKPLINFPATSSLPGTQKTYAKPGFTPVPTQNNTQVPTNMGVKTPQQQSVPMGGGLVDTLNSKGMASDYNSRAGMAAKYGITNYSGTASQNMSLLNAINGIPTPGYNPTSVDIKIGDNIPSEALNQTPSTTGSAENRKQTQSNVLNTRYGKEEEALLSNIASLRTGIAGLSATQAREYANLENNPSGMLTKQIGNTLDRLSKDQSMELNARTGQLNAYLDNLELYQGYRPKIIGTPQIDNVTGEAFSYIQDPMTGEITTQSLGQVTTPVAPKPFTLSEGESMIDPVTGEVIYKNPRTYESKTGGFTGFSGQPGTVSNDLSRMINVQGSFITSENQRNAYMGAANSYLEKGDYEGLRYYMRNQGVNNLPALEQTGYRKNIEIMKGLDNLDNILSKIEAKGVDTNLLKGSMQAITNKLGAQGDPELVSLGYQAQQAMDLITRQRTGAALNQSEEVFYKKMVPGIFKGADLNRQLVSEFRTALQNNTDSYLGVYFSPGEINTLDKASSPQGEQTLEQLINGLK